MKFSDVNIWKFLRDYDIFFGWSGRRRMFLELSWLIPTVLFLALPFIVILESKKTYAGALLSIIAGCIATILSIGGLVEILQGKSLSVDEMPKITWLAYGDMKISFGIYCDGLAMFMAFVVSFIGTLILVYSLEYMSHDREHSPLAWPRYFFEMTLFIAFMLMLVLSYSLLQLLIAWEGVGLCSYLLIGYWWWKPEAAKAAKKAFVTTRLGDVFLYAAVIYAFLVAKTLDIPLLNEMAVHHAIKGFDLALIALFAFGGAIGKSAQIPLFTWLPWAMEGPTTVSALIHAATMVKAGVYIVARLYPVYLNADPIYGFHPLEIVAYVGGFTAAFAGLVAVINNDIKGVLAYSTISHLGLLFFALGLGAHPDLALLAFLAAMLHLLNHAFFKAELFLVSGCILHATHDMRDIHKLGGLRERMKITMWLGLLGSLAIAGIFPFGGFWSKDEILIGASLTGNTILFILALIAALTGSLYIFRWFFIMFWGSPRSKEAEHAHEMPKIMTIPVGILAIGALLWGIPTLAFKPIGLIFVEAAMHHVSMDYGIHEMHAHHSSHGYLLMFSTLGVAILLALLMYYVYGKVRYDFSKYPILVKIQGLFQQGTFIDKAYDKFVYYLFGRGLSKLCAWIDAKFDKYFIESWHPLGAKLSKLVAEKVDIRFIDRIVEGFRPAFRALGRALGRIQTGHIGHYMALFGIGIAMLLTIFVMYWFGIVSLAFLLPK